MKYLTETLGIEARYEPWDGYAELPYYITDRYEFKKMTLGGISCLFLIPKSEPDTLNAIKKHIAKVSEIESAPIALLLDGISYLRRKSLIGARIPFVAAGCQIYLPFLGVALSERYTKAAPHSETLMPSSQLLLFYYLYQKETEMYTHTMANHLGFSAMQISRAVKQLKALELVSVRKDGVRITISSAKIRKDLFEKARPHLINPVIKKIYPDLCFCPPGLPQSGLSALSEMTQLNPGAVKTFAYFGKINDLDGSDTLIDSNIQAEVEIWRYSPTLLSKHSGMADPLSIVASILPTDDERIELAMDEVLSTLWR